MTFPFPGCDCYLCTHTPTPEELHRAYFGDDLEDYGVISYPYTQRHFVQTCEAILHSFVYAIKNEPREEYVLALLDEETITQEGLDMFKKMGYTWRGSFKYQGQRVININIFERNK